MRALPLGARGRGGRGRARPARRGPGVGAHHARAGRPDDGARPRRRAARALPPRGGRARTAGPCCARCRPAAAPRPVALPVTDDPEPFAREDHPDHAVYAPLTFEVGRERIEQWQGSFWSGNLLRARRSGTVHRATRVLRATPDGRGVRLVLATTDGRRRLVVRLGPDRGRALRVRARPVPARGVMTMADSFATAPGEAFHGFGGRHWGVDQRGRKLYGWTDQENFGGPMIKTLERGLGSLTTSALLGRTPADLGVPAPVIDTAPGGRDHYLFPNGPGGAYYPQGLFVSSRPYGFLLNQPELLALAHGRRPPRRLAGAGLRAPRLDYTVAVGAGPSAVRTLTAIDGRHRLPEAWAMGPSLLRAVPEHGRGEQRDLRREGPARPGRPRAPAPAAAQLRLRGLGAARRRGDRAPSWPACTASGCARCSTPAPTSPGTSLRTQPAEDFDRVDAGGRTSPPTRAAARSCSTRTARAASSSTPRARAGGAGGASASGGCSTSGPTASWTTSASRSSSPCTSTTGRRAGRCTTATRCSCTA